MVKQKLQIRKCPWCQKKQEEIDQDTIYCECGYWTTFCFLTGFAIDTNYKSKSGAVLIGPHGDTCTMDSTQRRIRFK